jgi:S-adenosylmethionine:diacylglycerol 3-amino-3-carboxypropyl transferase
MSDVELIQGTIFEIPSIKKFDLIQLSNIFDWSDAFEVKNTCTHLDRNMKVGAKVLIRQINNTAPIASYLGQNFEVHKELSESLLNKDKSLFYSNIIVATKLK